MKAILYARFSPRPDAAESESVETQLELCRAYCQRESLDVSGSFYDKAASGAEEDRPGLWSAIDMLRRKSVLVVYRLDRLARSVYLMYLIEQEVAKRGARILSVCGEGNGSSPDDELIRRILTALADYQRKAAAARTKAAMLRHQATGRRMSYKCPFGMREDPASSLNKKGRPSRLIPNEEEQRVIACICGMFERGYTYRGIAKALDSEQVECRGGRWHHRTVQKILKRAGKTL